MFVLCEIKNKKTEKFYVGQASRPIKSRWNEHRSSLRKNRHGNVYLQNAWNLYGKKTFKINILREFSSLKEPNKAEIDRFLSGKVHYNLSPGGNGFCHDNEAKLAISQANKKPIVGIRISDGNIF